MPVRAAWAISRSRSISPIWPQWGRCRVGPCFRWHFSAGFLALAKAHDVDLVGGDTTRGPLNVCVTIIGEVPRGRALRRDGARSGDDVWVSGWLGEAALAVAHRKRRVRLSASELIRCTRALELPRPRVALGCALRSFAHSAIDISDGLAGDLGHICERSGLGADVWIDAIPRSPTFRRRASTKEGLDALLGGGDDYELCFTAAQQDRARISRLAVRMGLALTRIGRMRRGQGVQLIDSDGRAVPRAMGGFDHFG